MDSVVIVVNRKAIIDTGPLVAILDKSEKHHDWAVEQIKQLSPPLLICEAVLTETVFLLRNFPNAGKTLFGLLEGGVINIEFELAQNLPEVNTILTKYRDQPASLADACLIRMSELHKEHLIFTLDSDFHIYRKHGRQPIKLIYP